jgi:hypothetical protein
LPNQKWGNAEKIQWLNEQQKKRSYQDEVIVKIQKLNKAIVCGWNKFVLALMIKVNDCPNKICSCKK